MMENIFQQIKAKINCLEYCENELGLTLTKMGNSYRCVSPIGSNNSNNTEFWIYEDSPEYFHDAKNGIDSDVIDLCAYVNHNGDRYLALEELKKITGIEASGDDFRNSNELMRDRCVYWHSELLKNQPVLDYLHARNINDTTINELCIGYSKQRERVMTPYFNQSNVITYFVGRDCSAITNNDINNSTNNQDNSKPSKYEKASSKKWPYGQNTLWGLNTLKREGPIIVTEGVFDALSCYQENKRILAFIGGPSNQQKKHLKLIARKNELVLMFDNDNAGIGFTERLALFLSDVTLNFKVVSIPKEIESKLSTDEIASSENGSTMIPIKDISDWYQFNGEVDMLIDRYSVSGLSYLCDLHFLGTQSILGAGKIEGGFKDFREFITKIARRPGVDLSELESILDDYKKVGALTPPQYNSLKKLIKNGPSQHQIVSEILSEHKIIYNTDQCFYEYEGGIWCKKTDGDIMKYISDKYGRFATGSKNKNTKNLLANDRNENITFNKKDILVFENGTLDLATGKLRPSDPSDYTTFKLNFEFSSTAACPRWMAFIEDIMDGDQSKINLLRQAAGYCLFSDNSLEKAFYFIGENGGNGKSVFLNVLKSVFGVKNVSTVQLSQLNRQFERIHLRDSIVNITTENTGNLNGCNGDFKQVVSGDLINGAFKCKNAVEFQPRCKMFVATNRMLETNIVDESLKRRIVFIAFNQVYRDNPDVERGEKPSDTQLLDKLLQELPGIFTWIYSGYCELARKRKFDLTAEHKALMREFELSSDNVAEYVSELNSDSLKSDRTSSEFYSDYRIWCSKNGIDKPLTARVFGKRFKKYFLASYRNWGVKHSNRGTLYFKK